MDEDKLFKENGDEYTKDEKVILKALNWAESELTDGTKTWSWQKMWSSSSARNYITKKPYNGVNAFFTALGGSDYYLTMSQIAELDGERWEKGKLVRFRKWNIKLRKGSKGVPIIFAKPYLPAEKRNELDRLGLDGEERQRFIARWTRFVHKLYFVYRIEDVDGLDYKPNTSENVFVPITDAETLLESCAVDIEYGGSENFYVPSMDIIHLTPRESFKTSESFYATAFHEMGHMTGHESRLARDMKGHFGSHDYSLEELIAEIHSALCCTNCGIFNEDVSKNSVAYIQNWLHVLKQNPKWITIACSKAKKAYEWTLANAGIENRIEEVENGTEIAEAV